MLMFFPALVPQFSAPTGPSLDTFFSAGPPLLPPAATFAPGQVNTPLFGAAPVVPEQGLQAKLREETDKIKQAESLSDESADQFAQATAQKRKVEEHYKAQAEKAKAEALAAAATAKHQHEQEILQMQQKHQAFAAQVEAQASSAIEQEAAKKSAAQVQSNRRH